MRTIVTLIAFLGLVSVTWVIGTRVVGGIRLGLVWASVALGTVAVLITETLGTLGFITARGLAVAWGLVGIVAVVTLLRMPSRARSLRRPRLAWMASGGLGLLTVPTLVVALASAPNNWDSMTYHMSRVARWATHGSLELYATAIDRQLWSSPLAEYLVLQPYVLGRSDVLANLVQWFALVLCAVCGSLLAARLSLGTLAEIIAPLLVLTLPAAVLEAPTTQNDLVTAAWLMSALALLPSGEINRATAPRLFLTALAVGLAALTKLTSTVFLLPFLLVWAWQHRTQWARVLASGAAILGVTLALSLPHFVRVTSVYGSPLGSGAALTGNGSPGPVALIENVIRNLAMNLATRWPEVNASIQNAVVTGMQSVGLDPNDPGATYAYGPGFSLLYASNEDTPTNPAVTILAVLSLLLVAIVPALRRALGAYTLALTVAFALFCLVFAWQPWGNRLLLPWFVLAAVVVAGTLTRVPRVVAALICVGLVVGAAPFMFNSNFRPLVGDANVLRTERPWEYFTARQEVAAGYVRAIEASRDLGARRILLIQGGDDYEYPLWALMSELNPSARLYEKVVDNPSERLVDAPPPDMMICTAECSPPPGWWVEELGHVRMAWPFEQ